MTMAVALATISLAIWCYLIFARGGFWLASVRDSQLAKADSNSQPVVTAVVPARNESGIIAQSLRSLLAQDYAGCFQVVLVDDQSSDGTAAEASATATMLHAQGRVTIVPGRPPPAGWTGKVWAMKQGVDHADSLPQPAQYLLLIDADIACAPHTLRRLVARAEAGGLALTSLMVKLRCETSAERGLIPAFVFFFSMLYPFAWVNRPSARTAAAAGGCMLVRREALRNAGGIESISNSLIDDCALAQRLKSIGPIWLGLTERARSLRAYPKFSDIQQMVSRTAYDQLRYSPLLLAGTIAALAMTFLAPPFFALFATGTSQLLGAVAWATMALAFQPILRFYRVSPLWGLALPAITAVYMLFTLNSAWQHLRGRGGLWKGRLHAKTSGVA